VVEKIKWSSLSPVEQEEKRKEIEERKKFPIPPIPDAKKFDKVFILPIFCKPGKNQYLIKYKDEAEPRQALLTK